MRILILAVLAIVSLLLVCAGASMAADRTLDLTNWVARDWPRTLLHYDLSFARGEMKPAALGVVDATGTPVQCQLVVLEKYADGTVKKGRVSFYAELAKGASAKYTVTAVQRPTDFRPRVQAKVQGDALEVTTDTVGVRIPAPQQHTFTNPVDPALVPAPLLGYRLSSGQWAGKGWLENERKVAAWSQKVVADGPLYKEYAYEVRFAPAGYYKARVRVEAEGVLAPVSEEYDMSSATAGKDFFVFSLNDGWQPDTALWAADRYPAGKQVQVRDRRVEHDTAVWREPLDFTADSEQTRLYPTGDWGPKAQWYGVFANTGDVASPFVGVMTMHTGAWRLPDQSLSPILWTKTGQVLVKFRTSINLNGSPQNPFGTNEIDPSLPQSLGRRTWALVLGPRPGLQQDGKTLDYTKLDFWRSYTGFINLNDYKDWVLSWDAKIVPGPRVFGTPESIKRLKADLDRCPGKEQIKSFSLLTGDVKTATDDAKAAMSAIDGRMNGALPYFCTHYRQTQMDYEPVFFADSALAFPNLPADLRQQLQAKTAAMCYMLSNADFNPRGTGTHMGNPNMAINRYMGLPLYATLVSDHPKAKAWLDDAYTYTQWKASFNVTSAGGTFRENPGYATYGPTNFMGIAAIALRNAGYRIDRFEPLKDIGRYYEAIDTPPTAPRGQYRKPIIDWLGGKKVRVLPGFGNGPDVPGGMTYMLLANLTAKSDPAFAARMQSDWIAAGQYQGSSDLMQPYYWLFWDPDIKEAPAPRTDNLLTGFGGILRAHADSPEETYVALRQGYTQSHWNPDQGTFVLYARGACLAPPTGWGYSGTAGICHDSRICFGTPLADHEHGRVDTNVVDYGFTPSVGYLLGRQTFKQRWDPTKKVENGQTTQTLKNDFDWSRQVVMIRSEQITAPNYVVVRDSTQGDCPLNNWWYQWIDAAKDNVQAIPGGVHVDAADGVKLDVTFVEPANPLVNIQGTKVGGFTEDYSQISVSQGPNTGYLTVFYPYKAGEPTPRKIERLGDGIIKVTNADSTDYVFCAINKPVVYKDDLVDINAYAGAVRILNDKVLLVNASGQQGSVGYKGVVASGTGPFEYTTSVNPARPALVNAGRKTVTPTPDNALMSSAGYWPGITGTITEKGGKTEYRAITGLGKLGDANFYVTGEAPFTVTHAPGKVTLVTEGRRRIFQMPIPTDIVPANMLPPVDSLPEDFKLNWSVGGWINWPWAVDVKVDGISYQGGWYDGLMTVGVPEGKHVVEITPYTNPPVWKENAYTGLLQVP